MKRRSIFFIFVVVAFFLYRKIDLPLTINEAKEAYSSYSIVKTDRDVKGKYPGVLFDVGGNIISTTAVYARIPFIYLGGLENFAVRFPAEITGLVSIYIFYLIAKLYLKNKLYLYLSVFLYSVSPFFIKVNIFEFSQTLGLLFCLLTFYFSLRKKYWTMAITGVLAIFSSVYSIVFVTTLFLYVLGKNKKYILFGGFSLFTLIIAVALTTAILRGKFDRQNVIADLNPKAYTYLIDRKLSFGKIESSPLITDKFNFNRLAHNKAFYFVNELFKSLVKPFDFEYLSSSFQAKTILEIEREDPTTIPAVYFWEVPFIFMGLLMALRRFGIWFNTLFLGGLLSFIIFRTNGLIYFLPSIIIAEVFLLHSIRKRYRLLFLVVFLSFYTFSSISLLDYIHYHANLWISQNDRIQKQTWEILDKIDVSNKIFVTDRLGEPAFYYFYYQKVDPTLVQKAKRFNITDSGLERIEDVSNIHFGSFKYLSDEKNRGDIWVGLPGEFLGENVLPKDASLIKNGYLFAKVQNIKSDNKLMGDELWFVESN